MSRLLETGRGLVNVPFRFTGTLGKVTIDLK